MYMQDKVPRSEVAYLVLASSFAVLVLTNIIGSGSFRPRPQRILRSASIHKTPMDLP